MKLNFGFILFIIVLISIIIVGGMYVKKQWFDDGSLLTTATKKSDAVSRISAAGGDFRVYEFTPETSPFMQCIFVAATNKGSTFCFPKQK